GKHPRSTTRPPRRITGVFASICSSLKMLRASKPDAFAWAAYLSRPLYGLLTALLLDAVPHGVKALAADGRERDELVGREAELALDGGEVAGALASVELVHLGREHEARQLRLGEAVQELAVGLLRVAARVHQQDDELER